MKKKDIIKLVQEAIQEVTSENLSSLPGVMEAGPSNNPYYNNLVKKATHKIVCFMDDDDIYTAEYIEHS